ncbi:hypothetical protein MMC08_008507 [Hypocenomyce scalaris]|nr:hypothetical protein [Hypocenomyce scalaris]
MGVIGQRDLGLHGRGMLLVIVSIVFTITSILLVIMRASSRLIIGRHLGKDDYTIMVSLVFSIAMGVLNCVAVDHGYGKLSTTLAVHDLRLALKVSSHQREECIRFHWDSLMGASSQMFWLVQIIYKCTITLTKTSIMLLYLRIFPQKGFRKAVFCVMAYVLLYAAASIIATIFQCNPIKRTFNHALPGSCINLTAFWYANAVASILGDFLILALPMPLIRSLHLPRRQKYGLIIVFALGGFVCVTSILRMTTLDPASKSADQTYGTLISTTWTTVEADTGIICACLPMLKTPLALMFPHIFLSPSSGDNSGHSGSHTRRTHYARRTSSTEQIKTQPSAPDSWGRPESKEGTLFHMPSVQGGYPLSAFASEERAVGKSHGQNIPMGVISKTTDVSVRYEEHDSISRGDGRNIGIPATTAAGHGGVPYG